MSVITDQIKSYRAGTIDLAALIAKLSRRTYPLPARMQGGPTNPFARAVWFDEQPSYTDGTWDEVLRARNYGLLTDDEYSQINAAFEVGHKDGSLGDGKALSAAEAGDLEAENREIRENIRDLGHGPHQFVAAHWTHPNGHPRCVKCGREEPIGGMCDGD